MCWFHRHRFDAEKWEKISAVDIAARATAGGVVVGEWYGAGSVVTYKNTCTVCGDLVFRRVRTVGP
jgi:hypothetical protein